jgi:murein DD-endopeptidase MepM/ murein hydrolase activator NlpD
MRLRNSFGKFRKLGRTAATLVGTLSLFFTLVIAAPPQVSQALSRYEVEQMQRENQARLNRLQIEYEGISQELAQILSNLDELENYKIPLVESEVALAEETAETEQAKADQLRKKLERAKELLEQLEQSLDRASEVSQQSRDGIVKLARNSLKGQIGIGQSGKIAQTILSPENSEEFIRALENDAMIARILSRMFDSSQWAFANGSNQQERMDQVREVVAQLSVEADQSAERAKQALEAAEIKKQELLNLRAELADTKVQVELNQDEIQRQQEVAKAEEQHLKDEIARIAAEELANGESSGPAPSTGYFGWPLANVNITQYFRGMTPDGSIYNPNHDGVDFGAPCGTPIYSSADGTVAAATQDFSGNIYVLVNHGIMGGKSYITSYNHMSSYIVSYGQSVAKGEVIGYVGSTGWSTGCHLHFAFAVDGVNVDPLGYIG